MTLPRRLALPALFLLLPLIFFHRVELGGEAYLLRDLFNWFYPWRAFTAESLARGDFPLWNPYSYAGTPFLANMQSGLLYPPNVVFWLFEFPTAMRLFLVVQFALSAGLMYLPLRASGCRPGSALTGAIGYAYGGWMLVNIEFPDKLAAAAWLPLIVHALILWRRGSRAAGLAVGAAATALCVTAGYPGTTFLVMSGAAVFWSVWLIRAAIHGSEPRAAIRAGLSLPAMAALGLLLASAQIVPFLEAASLSAYRVPFNPDALLDLGLQPTHFLQLALPHLFGLPGYSRFWGGAIGEFWLGCFHVGLATLALAPFCLAAVPIRRTRPDDEAARAGIVAGLALLLLACAFCLGRRTPLAPLLIDWVPGFGFLKWISTASLLVSFALCWLGALGQETLLRSLEGRHAPLARAWKLLPAGLAAAAAGAAILVLASPGTFHRIVEALVSPVAVASQRPLLAGNLAPVRADALRGGLIAALLVGAWYGIPARRRPDGLGMLVPLLLFLDLKGASAGVLFAGSPEPYRRVPPLAGQMQTLSDPLFRIYVPQATQQLDKVMYGSERIEHFTWAADTMLVNLNLPHRLFSASDGDPLRTERWKQVDDVIGSSGDDERGRLLALCNVGVVLRSGGAGTTHAIEIPIRMPRVYVSAGAMRVPPGGALAAILRSDFDPWIRSIVEGDFPGEPRRGDGSRIEQQVHGVHYTNNTVTIEVESGREGYLVLADSAYPGWRARLDGRLIPVFTVNDLFRGIDLPAGRHTVRFEYRPASVAWGVAGSGLGLILAAAAARAATRRSGSSRQVPDGGGTAPAPPRTAPSP